MLNVGGPEFLIILLVALVVLGPTRLPDALRQVGKFIGEAKKVSASFQNEMQAAMNDPVKAATGVEIPKTTDEVVRKFAVPEPFAAQEAPPKTAPEGEGDGLDGAPAPNVEASIEPAQPAEPTLPAEPAQQGQPAPSKEESASKIEPAALPPKQSGYEPVGEIGATSNGDGLDSGASAKPITGENDDVPMFGDR